MAFLTASLVLFLLGFSSKVVAEVQRIIRAKPGDNVILTCRAAENKDIVVVWWNRTDLESDQYVLLYRDNHFFPEIQSPSFRNRVSLLDVKNRDVSLVLKNVTTDDTGTYECRVVQRGDNHRKRSILDTESISTINLSVEAGQRIITAEPGEDAILTCRPAENKDVIAVEWSRTDLESDQYVLLYIDQFDPEFQPPSFRNRVDLLDVENGDVSLVLKNVTTDDGGTYECRVVQGGNNRRKRSHLKTESICIVNLIVEAGNQEKQKEDGGNKTGLIVGLLVGILALVSLVGFLLYRNRGHLCQEQKPSPAAGVELEPMNPEILQLKSEHQGINSSRKKTFSSVTEYKGTIKTHLVLCCRDKRRTNKRSQISCCRSSC